jgi:hypothetical protein
MFVIGTCWSCKNVFTFNADHVPSIPIDPTCNRPADMGGDPAKCEREPLCSTCITRANIKRRASGQEPIYVHPDAYSEGVYD